MFQKLHIARPYAALFLLLMVTQSAIAQSVSGLDLVRSLKLLESTREEVSKALSNDTFDVWDSTDRQIFYRNFENIEAYYSSGTCLDKLDPYIDFLPPDVWNIGNGRLVLIRFEPKQEIRLRTLGFETAKFRKERLFRSHKDLYVYFDKETGIAIRSLGDYVQAVDLYPGKRNLPRLCKGVEEVSSFFHHDKWRLRKEHKSNIVDFNLPANVRDVKITFPETALRIAKVEVMTDDPENDIFTYLYRVSAGQITSKGNIATWDLTSVPPGSYEIKVAADDGIGPRGIWLSQWIEIK